MAGSDNKGKPSGEGKNKGTIKEENAKRVLDLEKEEVYRERYTDEEGENAEGNVRKKIRTGTLIKAPRDSTMWSQKRGCLII